MPYIASQFMLHASQGRPAVRPKGAKNLVLLGQFTEMPRNMVFKVEYSVCPEMKAVHEMTEKTLPPLARTDKDPVLLLRAARTLFGL